MREYQRIIRLKSACLVAMLLGGSSVTSDGEIGGQAQMRFGRPGIEIQRLLGGDANLRQTVLSGLFARGELEPMHARQAGPCPSRLGVEAQRPLILLLGSSQIAGYPALSEERRPTQLLGDHTDGLGIGRNRFAPLPDPNDTEQAHDHRHCQYDGRPPRIRGTRQQWQWLFGCFNQQWLQLPDEPIPLSWHCLDVSRSLCLIAERGAQAPNRCVQSRVVFHYPFRPQPGNEMLARDNFTRPGKQLVENTQGLFLQPHSYAIAQ